MEGKSLMVLAAISIAAVAAVGGITLVVFDDQSEVYSLELVTEGHGTVTKESVGENSYRLSATCDQHYVFCGWYAGKTLLSQDPDYTIDLSKNTIVSAVFELEKMNVTTSAQYDGGHITVGGTCGYGTYVTLMQTPEEGFAFTGWYQNEQLISNSPSYTFEINEDCSFEAGYAVDHSASIDLTIKDIGAPTTLMLFYESKSIKEIFSYFSLNGNIFLCTNFKSVEITEAGSYGAETIITYVDNTSETRMLSLDVERRFTVTLGDEEGGHYWFTSSGENGTRSMDFLKGQDVFLSAASDYGYDLDGWVVNGGKTSNKDLCVGIPSISRDYEIGADFTLHKFEVTFNATYPNGISTMTTTPLVPYKEYATINVQTRDGYIFDGISIDGGELIKTNSYRFQVLKDVDVKIVMHLSHDVRVTITKSSNVAPMTVTVHTLPGIADASYHLNAYDSWNKKTLFDGTCVSNQGITVSNYGIFNATVEVNFSDGHHETVSVENEMIDGIKTVNYQWKYQTKDWLTSLIPSFNNHSESIKCEIHFKDYYEAVKPTTKHSELQLKDYPNFVSPNDPYVKGIANYIVNLTKNNTSLERADCALKFVQSFTYTYDSDQQGVLDYAMYPVELLWSKTGDCEDHAILYASIMKAMQYDVVLFYVKTPSGYHMAVGLNHSDASGTHYLFNGKNYYYCEPTSTSSGNTYVNNAEIGYKPDNWIVLQIIPV